MMTRQIGMSILPTTERTGKPNDYLVAPEGATTGTAGPDCAHARRGNRAICCSSSTRSLSPSGARAIIAGSVDEGWITYVQRTMLLGFPDYISVKAIPVEGGACADHLVTLALWTQRFWREQENAIDAWLAQIAE